jgi:EAL domain-containing protein (putative c-di-GMP-specific phosphodiesterase class I)
VFSELARKNSEKVAVRLTFSNELAHRIEASADLFLMPSRYEPCGLNQLYSLKYGTVPVVHATGGLADSITNLTPETEASETANGFSFEIYTTAALAETLEQALADPLPLRAGPQPTTASIGLALSGPDARDAQTLLRNAGSAMNRAKARGRACFEIFDAGMHARSMRALALSRALALAEQRAELALVYQPIYSLADRRLEGFEALLRWAHDGQAVSPEEFIPLAERSGSVVPLGLWVLGQASGQLAEWQERWPDVHVAINLSARQIAEPGLVDEVAAVLDRSGARPAGLTFEVTETTVVAEPQEAIAVLGALRGMGCRLLLDDFGTGFSSLEHVARFEVDGLKVDRSFVARCEHDAAARAVVDAVVGLATGLGCEVVAEGVETSGQEQLVQAAGCEFGQGYLFGPGLPAHEAARLLERHAGQAAARGRVR